MKRLLFDLDDVIRFYPIEKTSNIELIFGLEIGSIYNVALKGDLIRKVTTGMISRKEWIQEIGKRVGSMKAAEAWNVRYFYVDTKVISLLIELNKFGIPIDLITNGTNELRRELQDLNLLYLFSEVFNSAEIGWAKPDYRIFDFVLETLKCNSNKILFVDDRPENINTASSMGFKTFLYEESRFNELISFLRSEILFHFNLK